MDHLDIVTHLFQCLQHWFLDPFLNIHNVHLLLSSLWHACADTDPGRIQCLLWIHPKNLHVQQYLDMSLRLHKPSHDTVD